MCERERERETSACVDVRCESQLTCASAIFFRLGFLMPPREKQRGQKTERERQRERDRERERERERKRKRDMNYTYTDDLLIIKK